MGFVVVQHLAAKQTQHFVAVRGWRGHVDHVMGCGRDWVGVVVVAAVDIAGVVVENHNVFDFSRNSWGWNNSAHYSQGAILGYVAVMQYVFE